MSAVWQELLLIHYNACRKFNTWLMQLQRARGYSTGTLDTPAASAGVVTARCVVLLTFWPPMPWPMRTTGGLSPA